jgi:transposase InsO family protein
VEERRWSPPPSRDVKTIKHDYIAFMRKPDVPTALLHLAGAFQHYNERHPHKALKYRSPGSSGEPLHHQLNGVRVS